MSNTEFNDYETLEDIYCSLHEMRDRLEFLLRQLDRILTGE
jgi:hypothetical protein